MYRHRQSQQPLHPFLFTPIVFQWPTKSQLQSIPIPPSVSSSSSSHRLHGWSLKWTNALELRIFIDNPAETTTSSSSEEEKNDALCQFVASQVHRFYGHLSSICPKQLNVWFFLTPIPKQFPDENVLQREHINTGFTYAGKTPINEIIIYRREECRKTFLHELMHALGGDFAYSPDLCAYADRQWEKYSSLRKRDPATAPATAPTPFALFETFSETCATLAMHTAYNHQATTATAADTFLLEQAFSALQVCKLCIRIYHLPTADEVIRTLLTPNLYPPFTIMESSETHPTAYHLFKSALLHNIDAFLSFCQNHQLFFYGIGSDQPWSKKAVDDFVHLILQSLYRPFFHQAIRDAFDAWTTTTDIDDFWRQTLQMTITDQLFPSWRVTPLR